jgi:phosphatidylserine decarboxylase
MSRKTAYKPVPKNRFITREGYPYIAAGILLTVLMSAAGLYYLVFFSALLTAFVCFFFRNPVRNPHPDKGIITAPADGRILAVEKMEWDTRIGGPAVKISTFMSIFNCHVNRMPVSGTVERVIYEPGKFFAASLDKASLHNEKNTVILKDESNRRIAVVQIAGIVARRIVCYLKEGFFPEKGSRFGMICFGSRVDLFLPEGSAEVLVKKGDRVKAGETVVGRWLGA